MPKQYMYGAVKTPAVAAIGPIPIATPKRLKIAVTDSKQNTEAISNRYKNGPSGARENCKFCASAAKTGLIRNDLSARLKSCPDENRRCHTNSESPSRRGFRSLGSPGSLLKRGLLRETRPIYGPGSDTMFICAKHSVNNTQIQSAGVLSANLDAAFEAILCH
jgi:hypothetical protein